jgi:hypothetical protein
LIALSVVPAFKDATDMSHDKLWRGLMTSIIMHVNHISFSYTYVLKIHFLTKSPEALMKMSSDMLQTLTMQTPFHFGLFPPFSTYQISSLVIFVNCGLFHTELTCAHIQHMLRAACVDKTNKISCGCQQYVCKFLTKQIPQ